MSSTGRTVPVWIANLARWAYTTVWIFLLPMAMLYLLWRSRRQPEYRQHWAERFGRFKGNDSPGQPLIWVHAVSVGETRAAEPLIRLLLEKWPDYALLLTHMTPTGRATGRSIYVDANPQHNVYQAYLPYDLPWFTAALLRHFKPVVGVIMETELWPNLVQSAVSAGVPLVIANARLSQKSLARGNRFRVLLAPALEQISLFLAQTDADAARIAQLAPVDAPVVGNVKFDVRPDGSLLALGREWRLRVGCPVVVLASSRDGEEQLVLNAWQRAARDDVLLIIVPRHPQRFDEVRALINETALPMADRQSLEVPYETEGGAWVQPTPRILLGNSMGEMPAWYAMADVVLMGGSLLPHGGQNLIEACACGAPVILGPSTFNFKQAAEQAIQINAAVRVTDAAQAVSSALDLIDEPTRLAVMAQSAVQFASTHRGATARSVDKISALLQSHRKSTGRSG